MKNKTTAGFFALLLGPFGLHRFYLGEKGMGKFYFIATLALFQMSFLVHKPLILIMGLISLIEATLLLSMPKEEFNEKYNQRSRNAAETAPRQPSQKLYAPPQSNNPYKAAGLEKFKEYDYNGAQQDFKNSLAIQFDDPAVHFNLACCYSLNEQPDPAFFHLTKAVHFGFIDFDKIDQHQGLAYLRTMPQFRDFVKNGYQLHHALPAEDAPVSLSHLAIASQQPNLLDQLKRLREMREQGLLTEEEFKGMKTALVRN